MSVIVTLKKGEGRTIKAGGAWIFDNEIDTITGRFKNGEVVTVHDFDGYPMGKGFINQNSKIRIRMMTRKPDQEIDESFLKMRVKNAWEYRKTTVDTSSCRIIFGEADFLPGLVIDKYEDVLVVECLALGMEQFKEIIVNFLKDILAEDGIKIRGVYERMWRSWKTAFIIWSMSRMARKPDFSSTRNTIVLPCSVSAKARKF